MLYSCQNYLFIRNVMTIFNKIEYFIMRYFLFRRLFNILKELQHIKGVSDILLTN